MYDNLQKGWEGKIKELFVVGCFSYSVSGLGAGFEAPDDLR
jgi:hypothetical protein